MNTDKYKDNENDANKKPDSLLRKVQSLGCVRTKIVRPIIISCEDNNNIYHQFDSSLGKVFDPKQHQVASKFSKSASSGTGFRRAGKNTFNVDKSSFVHSVEKTSSVRRNSPLVIVEETPNTQGSPSRTYNYSLNMSRRVVGYVSVILLIIATIHAHDHGSHSGATTGSSSSKLGPAALSSLTSVLSPILPFAGGADLRRGETLLDMLPTSTFDAFHSWSASIITDSLNIIRWKTTSNYNIQTEESKLETTIRVPRGGGDNDGSAVMNDVIQKKERLALRKTLEAQPSIMAQSDPFVSPDQIGQLTLEELGDLFYFTIMHNSKGFDREKNLSNNNVSPAAKQIIQGIEDVTDQIRGSGVLPALTSANIDDDGNLSANGYGDVDALSFLALMRVFAEWRVLRQVPDGYRGYAVGMNLGHKDVVQNLAKVELAVLLWIVERRDFITNENDRIARLKEENDGEEKNNESLEDFLVLRSPTLRDLLQYEIDTDLHDGKLPSLKEKSAGMGLLWVRRQLHYQLAIYSNMDSGKFSSTNEAVAEAYKEVYEHCHGWAVQKIFNYSFQAAPDSKEIFKTMNPKYLQQLLLEARRNNSPQEEEMSDLRQDIQEEDSSEDDVNDNNTKSNFEDEVVVKSHDNIFVQLCNHIGSAGKHIQIESDKMGKHIQIESDKLGKHIHKEWDNFGKHVNSEWKKIVSNVGNILKINDDKNNVNSDVVEENVDNSNCDILRGGGEAVEEEDEASFDQASISNVIDQLSRETHRQISVFLKVSKPVLEDLSGLFNEMNMNDPKKV